MSGDIPSQNRGSQKTSPLVTATPPPIPEERALNVPNMAV